MGFVDRFVFANCTGSQLDTDTDWLSWLLEMVPLFVITSVALSPAAGTRPEISVPVHEGEGAEAVALQLGPAA